MSNYQGHLADGSSVQKHSAGNAYPFVCQLRDNPRGGYYWEMLGPGIEGALRFNSGEEWDEAFFRLKAVRGNEDAWAFELEQLQYVALQRQVAMRAAACSWRGQGVWAGMSAAERVASLLALGKVRRTLRLPMASRPVFEQLAAAAV